jgi:hypothetical protein
MLPLIPNLASLEMVWSVQEYTEQDVTAFIKSILQIESLLSIFVSENAPKEVQEACRYVLDRNRVLSLLQDDTIPRAIWTKVLVRFNQNVQRDVSALHVSVHALANRITE